jgi:hypothetical protein
VDQDRCAKSTLFAGETNNWGCNNMSKASADFDPFVFFKEEAGHNDVVVRTEAMGSLVAIASIMDPAVVRDEMIPFLMSMFIGLCLQ